MTSPSLHRRIVADLAGEIASGAWPPGHRLPFEHELMRRYGCARATASRAVHVLVSQGLVERRRRAGSFVSRPHAASAVLHIPDIRAAIEGRGQDYDWRLLSRMDGGGASVVDLERLNPIGPLLSVRGVHLADKEAFGLEERVIDLAAAPQAEAESFAEVPPGAWLLAHVAWSEARHEISAVNPDRRTAATLGVEHSRACLAVRRWTWRGAAGVTFVRQTFPSGLLDLVAEFTPGAR